ncbi:class I SAM-dependent methyltransferase [Methanospirillum lacunae]|nr:class I SAM-dependent methyltransferase [Methanospirillum lacunae]
MNSFRKCPICESNDVKLIIPLNYIQFDDCPIHGNNNLVACVSCGFLFNDTDSKEEDYERYYAQKEYNFTGNCIGSGSIIPEELIRYEIITQLIQSYKPSTSKILDIGCGKGGLLINLKNQGYTNLYALELLPQFVDYLNHNYGINTIQGSFQQISLFSTKFDVIIASNVLEHIFDLNLALQYISQNLGEEGIVYLEVPNAKNYPSFNNYPLFDFSHEHINHFDYHHLTNLAKNNGFDLILKGTTFIKGGFGKGECIYIVIKKGLKQQKIPDFTLSDTVTNVLMSYSANSKDIQELMQNQLPTYIWGFSSYMGLILGMSELQACNIIGIIDKDESKQKHTIMGKKILPLKIFDKISNYSVIIIPTGSYVIEMRKILRDKNIKCPIIQV